MTRVGGWKTKKMRGLCKEGHGSKALEAEEVQMRMTYRIHDRTFIHTLSGKLRSSSNQNALPDPVDENESD